jgi:alkanesulfonate monooxygenase SsuD/methylene tetrahydromethanopterin reductase-like flavin-dependent oxidoreductase (luciferase family)
MVAGWARDAEKIGFDGVFLAEGKRDPFLSLSRAVEATERVELGTGIAVAFARSPMQMAYTAQELQQHSRGRLVLGLGPQVKSHIERPLPAPGRPGGHGRGRARRHVGGLARRVDRGVCQVSVAV